MYQEISGIMYQSVSERIRCRHISHNIIHISRRIEAVYQTLRHGFDTRNVIHVSRVYQMYRGISTYTCVKCVILRDTQFWYIFWTWWFFRVGSHGVSVDMWDPTRYHAPWDPTDLWYLSWYFSFWWILIYAWYTVICFDTLKYAMMKLWYWLIYAWYLLILIQQTDANYTTNRASPWTRVREKRVRRGAAAG